jgi:hypothetical protein
MVWSENDKKNSVNLLRFDQSRNAYPTRIVCVWKFTPAICASVSESNQDSGFRIQAA